MSTKTYIAWVHHRNGWNEQESHMTKSEAIAFAAEQSQDKSVTRVDLIEEGAPSPISPEGGYDHLTNGGFWGIAKELNTITK